MNSRIGYFLVILTAITMIGCNSRTSTTDQATPPPSADEVVYYTNDFEGPTVETNAASPLWALSGTNNVVGPGNLFELTTTKAHRGSQSLRFSYTGRGGICNSCGHYDVYQKAGHDNVVYLIDANGADLTQDPYYAQPGRVIYNKDNGFSSWIVDSVNSIDAVNDSLTVTKLADGMGGVIGEFNGGDRVGIARQCGVDGTVGGQIDRRSDCDVAISYFTTGKVNGSQAYGQSLFRRVYLMTEGQATPIYNQKLFYWTPQSGIPAIPIARYQVAMSPDINLNQMWGKANGDHGIASPAQPAFKPGIWYYLEHELRASSGPGVNDGLIRMWFAEAGNESNAELLEITDIPLETVKDHSLWGNHQHFVDGSGYWYMDDIKISSHRIGAQ